MRRSDLPKIAGQAAAAAHLLRRKGHIAWTETAADHPGHTGASSGDPVSGGDRSDPTPAAAEELARRGSAHQRLRAAVARFQRSAEELAVEIHAAVGHLDENGEPHRKPHPRVNRQLRPGAGECQCCGDWVSGVGDDRLRSGECPACNKAVVREMRRSGIDRQQARRHRQAATSEERV